MVWEVVFVNGPDEKQRKTYSDILFLHTSGKQREPIEKLWFGKSFLLTVLRKTK